MKLYSLNRFCPYSAMSLPSPLRPLSAGELSGSLPVISPQGFREYDARWWFGIPGHPRQPDLNPAGLHRLGLGIGTLLHEQRCAPEIVVGHDFREYSLVVQQALCAGLMAAGIRVHDIGLSISPMAYFAQFDLDIAAVAMVTASHNENGWTGVKIGIDRPVTLGSAQMGRLKDIVLGGQYREAAGGSYHAVDGMAERYMGDLCARPRLRRRWKVVVACGNGTAGQFAPAVLDRLGCDVVALDCELDARFPNYNPNPESVIMLGRMAEAVAASGADLALGLDGDGDRVGFVDNTGRAIYPDKVGVLLARHISAGDGDARFVVDVKSTGLFATDPVLAGRNIPVDYWKTGHSHIKRRLRELSATVAFERSGHVFFGPPFGRGYDDGLLAAIAVLEMLDANPEQSFAQLYDELPVTYSSPTMSPHCADDKKYAVVERIAATLSDMRETGERIAGSIICGINGINGIRVTLDDGTWGLVRASSNLPELVVVVESPVSAERMRQMFEALDVLIRRHPEVGAYNQTF